MKTIKRKPVVMDVANQIRAAILEGGLVPGSKIAQDALAAELGVSRLPIRQALLVLQREGLVTLDHGRGAVVAPFDIKFISDLFDFRAAVDSYVAGVLATRAEFDAGPIRKIVREGREAARHGESRRDLVTRFHTDQYEATGNQVLSRIMEPLLDHVQRVVTFVQTSASPKAGQRPGKSAPTGRLSGLRSQAETWDEHGEIIEAIARRDVGRARALARHHVDRVKQVVVPFLVSSVPPKQHPGSSSQHRRSSGVGAQRERAGRAVTFDSSLLK
jgi:DNA-binding GntR family transcriptional regulator